MEDSNVLNNILNMAKDQEHPGLDQDTIDMLNQFKVQCPVRKLNFTVEDPRILLGMWIVTHPRGVDIIRDKADLSGLTNNTILVFTERHIYEMACVMNGMLGPIRNMDQSVTAEKCFNHVKDFMDFCKRFQTYYAYNKYWDKWGSPGNEIYMSSSPKAAVNKQMTEIMRLLPFISYADLDALSQQAVHELEKSVKEKQNSSQPGPSLKDVKNSVESQSDVS